MLWYSRKEGSISYRAEDCRHEENKFYIINSGGLSSRKEGSLSYRADDCRDVVEKKVLYHTELKIVVM